MAKITKVKFYKFKHLTDAINEVVTGTHEDVIKVTIKALATNLLQSAEEAKISVSPRDIYRVISSTALNLSDNKQKVVLDFRTTDFKILDTLTEEELNDD
jgi:hypothetical protein